MPNYTQRHHDDEYLDEVTITTVPRYKTSGLSGDEWRVSARLELRRKGILVWYRGFSSIETAAAALPWFMKVASEGPDGKDAGEWSRVPDPIEDRFCQQPGCKESSVNEYRFKQLQVSRGDHIMKPGTDAMGTEYRTRFCARHSVRGDCGLEDCDSNLELVSGSGVTARRVEDESPSGFGGVI